MAVSRTYTDIDEHAAQMSGFDQRYLQLSPGAFRGVFSSLALPGGLGFDVEWVAQALHQQAAVPERTVSLVTFLELGGRAIFNGREVKRFDTVFLPPGASFDVRTPPNARIAVVTLPLGLLADEWRASAGPSLIEPAIGATHLLAAADAALLLEPVLAPLLRAIDAGVAPGLDDRVMASGLLESALMLLDRLHGRAEQLEMRCARRRRDAFALTKEAIDRLDPSELSIGRLCRMAGVSRRTLEYCFEESVAMSPLQYLKVRRLNGVRRELLTGAAAQTTIGDVAARHGIWHLGRLSREYAQLFGELPSATLQRRQPPSARPGVGHPPRRGAMR